jgi:hypothetical protein
MSEVDVGTLVIATKANWSLESPFSLNDLMISWLFFLLFSLNIPCVALTAPSDHKGFMFRIRNTTISSKFEIKF